MPGETIRTEAICLSITPWSRTSHIVHWLTPDGRVSTVVKGAVRPKSAFLGQYDLNYTCEILYYARAHGDLHALRACAPLALRETLRGNFRALALAARFRDLAERLAPQGPEARTWFELLAGEDGLDGLCRLGGTPAAPLRALLAFELAVLNLLGLYPEIEAGEGRFALRGERRIPVSAEVASALSGLKKENNLQTLLDTTRVIGVYYAFHVEESSDIRRSILKILQTQTTR